MKIAKLVKAKLRIAKLVNLKLAIIKFKSGQYENVKIETEKTVIKKYKINFSLSNMRQLQMVQAA